MRPSSFFLYLGCGSVSTLALGLPPFSDIRAVSHSLVSRVLHETQETRSSGIIKRQDGACPPVWGDVAQELTGAFLENGECNADARAAIRASFHDCGSWDLTLGETGGCDGSLVLAPDELGRVGNERLRDISNKVLGWARKYNVSVADMFVFAGNHATVSCRRGPIVPTFVGRPESNTSAPQGLLPSPFWEASRIISNFADKGFTPDELVALVGAHTTSKQAGFAAQDSTPETWDAKFYAETLPDSEVKPDLVFPSDRNLAVHEKTTQKFHEFAANQDNQTEWRNLYSRAMLKMTLNGVPGGIDSLVDCTSFLPAERN